MTDHVALKAELDAGHPSTGAYNADDALALGELEAVNRPVDSPTTAMTRYLAVNKFRSNEGEDDTATSLLGRLQRVTRARAWSDVFRRGGVWVAGASAGNNIILDALANQITFGGNHDISSLNDNQTIELTGTRKDDGMHQVVSVAAQVVTVDLIEVSSTLERAASRVYWVRDNDLITPKQIDAARMFAALVLESGFLAIQFADTELDDFYTQMQAAAVWGPNDSIALRNLSAGKQSRRTELGFGRLVVGDITYARTLP